MSLIRPDNRIGVKSNKILVKHIMFLEHIFIRAIMLEIKKAILVASNGKPEYVGLENYTVDNLRYEWTTYTILGQC